MWLKNFRIRKLQTFMMAVIVLLCALLMGSSVSILSLLDKPFHELAEECESPQAVVYPYASEQEAVMGLAEQMEGLEEIEEVVVLKQHYLNEEVSVNEEKLECFVQLAEYNDRVFGKVRYAEGSREKALALTEKECIIPACIANKYKIKVGDILTVNMPEEKLEYEIKGIYADPYNASAAYDSRILIKELPGQISFKQQIDIYYQPDVTVGDIEEAYQDAYSMQFPGQFNTVEDSINNAILASKLLGSILMAIGVIMLGVSCLIINFIVRNALIADAKTIAIYKTMGYGTGDILKMYLLFYFAIASVSTIAGIFLSKNFSTGVLEQMFEDIGMKAEVSVLGVGSFCYLLIVGLIVLTVYLVMQKTGKVKPVYALNGMSLSNSGKRKQYKGSYQGDFSSFGIAMRMMIRNKRGLIGILITAVVTVIGMNFATISLDVANGMKENNDYWLGLDQSQIMITLSDNVQSQEVEELLNGDTRIEKVIPCSLGGNNGILTLEYKENLNLRVIYPFIYENYDNVDLDIYEGRNPRNGEEIAIAGKVAEETQKGIGDYLTANMNGEEKSFLITGLYQTYYSMGKNCRLTTSAYKDMGEAFAYDTLSIYLRESEDIDSFIEDAEEKIGGRGKVLPRTEQFASIMEMIMKPQKSAIPPMTLLVLVISGANIFCIVLLKNAKEEKINGIYKCIGYSTGHLVMANVIYIGILAAVTIAIAIPIVLAIYPGVMKLSLGMFGLLEYKVTYNAVHLVIANGAVFITFIISTLLSSRSLRKVNIRGLVCE